MIEVEGLGKSYGEVRALDGISFTVARGEVLGFLGPNGAGKSTTMRILTGSLMASEGTARVGGHDVVDAAHEARRLIGYLPENVPLYREMRVRPFLSWCASLRGVSRARRRAACDAALERTRLTELARRPIHTLSRGQRQRVGLAQALVHDPPVLILDEPTAGLDPEQIAAVRETIAELGEDRTVILSTHILPEVARSCDRAVIIARGRVLADEPVEQLRRRASGARTLTLLVDRPEGLADALSGLEGVLDVRSGEPVEGVERILVDTGPGLDLRREVGALAWEHGLVELHQRQRSLEEVFLDLVREEDA